MKKKILSLFLILTFILFAGCSLQDVSSSEYRQELALKEKYLQAVNEISIDFMSSNIMVMTKYYKYYVYEGAGQGSGVIFKKQTLTGGIYKYYVLTNYHVTRAESGYQREWSSTDYMDAEIQSTLVFEDDDYDLAVITFESTNVYNVCEFAKVNPSVDDGVFALGQPLGQRNAITFGYVKEYRTESYDWCDIDFPCIFHTAHMDSGNSGGVLLNADIELCGINFATGTYTDILTNTTSNVSVSIPVEKVKECLDTHLITY